MEEEGPPTEGEPCLVDVGCEVPFFCVSTGCLENAAGTCLTVPDDCSDEPLSPVCACDGETYDNRCEAHRLRRNVQIAGPCS